MGRKCMGVVVAVLAVALVVAWTYPLPAADRGKGTDRVLSKVTFIHFKKGHAKPPNPGGGKGGGKGGAGYYTYMSNGMKWRTPEDFRLNLACGENVGGSLDQVIEDAVAAGMNEWETPGKNTLDIFKNVVVDQSAAYDNGDFRGFNTISFGEYQGDPDVIAITSVWGYFSGPPQGREILEAHILMNDACEWGDASVDSDGDGSPDYFLMDIQNILTHELGHVAGMGDLYETAASEETMFGYSTEGELKKRDLYKGDTAGITKLYR